MGTQGSRARLPAGGFFERPDSVRGVSHPLLTCWDVISASRWTSTYIQNTIYLCKSILSHMHLVFRTSIEKDILEEADMGRRINSVNDRFIRHLYACVLNVRHKVEILKAKKSDATSEGYNMISIHVYMRKSVCESVITDDVM